MQVSRTNPQRNDGMTLKKGIITRDNKSRDSDPRRCQQAAAPTMREARSYYLFVIALLAVGWGFFVVGLVWLFNKAKPLENLWTGTQANLTELCIKGSIVAGWGLLFLFSTLVLYTSAREQLRIASELEREGITAPGAIIDKWTARGEGTSYFVGYRFNYMGNTWVGRDIVKSSSYNQLQIGDSVVIYFLPRNPRVSRTEQDESRKLMQ